MRLLSSRAERDFEHHAVVERAGAGSTIKAFPDASTAEDIKTARPMCRANSTLTACTEASVPPTAFRLPDRPAT